MDIIGCREDDDECPKSILSILYVQSDNIIDGLSMTQISAADRT